MPSAYERKKAERERNREAGMVRKDLWVFPKVWPQIKAFAEKMNATEKGRSDG